MSTDTIILRNTISKVSHAFEASYAKRLLADPHYGKILEVVDSEKPEVLGQPKIDGKPIDDDGETIERAYDADSTTFGDPDTVPAKAPVAKTKKD